MSSAPFPGSGRYEGRAQIRSFATKHLTKDVRADLTKKQVARNGVAWTVRALTDDEPEERIRGVIEAEFRGREIKLLRLGTGT